MNFFWLVIIEFVGQKRPLVVREHHSIPEQILNIASSSETRSRLKHVTYYDCDMFSRGLLSRNDKKKSVVASRASL